MWFTVKKPNASSHLSISIDRCLVLASRKRLARELQGAMNVNNNMRRTGWMPCPNVVAVVVDNHRSEVQLQHGVQQALWS